MAKGLKKGQSKYMPHLRKAARPAISNGIGHIPNSQHSQMVVNEYGVARTPEELKTKGKFGGLCNRSCCLRREAYWYNRGSYAYYCEDCARLINDEFRFRDDVELYASLLVQAPLDVDIIDLDAIYGDLEREHLWSDTHPKPWAVQYSNGHMVYFATEEEAAAAQRHYRRVTGLRSDGSNPLWFSDLTKRYEELRKQVTIKGNR